MNANEFNFEMKDESQKVVSTGTNDADGNVNMSTLSFTKPGVYKYTLSEVKSELGGVDSDQSVYSVVADVSDNHDGTLGIEWTVTNANGEQVKEVVYNNTYSADPTSVSLTMAKVLAGRDLKADEFTFVVKDSDNNTVAELKNDEMGQFVFALTFDAVGEYTYTVSEVKGDDKDITYDESGYTITVNVTDDLVGQLHAETTITKDGEVVDGIVFSNTYTEPEKSVEPAGPSTGVWTNPAPFAVTFTASLAAILAILYRRLH